MLDTDTQDIPPTPITAEDPNTDTVTTAKPGPNAFRSSWAIGGDAITQNTAAMPKHHGDAVRWLYAHAQLEKLSLSQAAAAVKVDTTTLHRVIRNTYGASLDNVVTKINTYRHLVEQRSQLNRLDFIPTSVTRKIDQVCEWALVSQTIAFIFGDSQIGKTTALERYAKDHNSGQTKFIRLPASSGFVLLVHEIAKACHLSHESSWSAVRERVMKAIDSSHLVIVDELHQVFTTCGRDAALKCVEFLREIHDRTKCGMVLCGTNVLRKELESGRHAGVLDQLRRRGVTELQLPSKLPQRDLDAVAKAYGLEPATGAAEDLVKHIMHSHGLGKFTKFLQAAGRYAHKEGKPLNWGHFIKTHDILAKLSEASK